MTGILLRAESNHLNEREFPLFLLVSCCMQEEKEGLLLIMQQKTPFLESIFLRLISDWLRSLLLNILRDPFFEKKIHDQQLRTFCIIYRLAFSSFKQKISK